MIKSDIVFENIQEILNSSESVVVSKGIEILWAKRTLDDMVEGFVRIGDRVMEFSAVLFDDGLTVRIGERTFEFSKEEVEKVIKG